MECEAPELDLPSILEHKFMPELTPLQPDEALASLARLLARQFFEPRSPRVFCFRKTLLLVCVEGAHEDSRVIDGFRFGVEGAPADSTSRVIDGFRFGIAAQLSSASARR